MEVKKSRCSWLCNFCCTGFGVVVDSKEKFQVSLHVGSCFMFSVAAATADCIQSVIDLGESSSRSVSNHSSSNINSKTSSGDISIHSSSARGLSSSELVTSSRPSSSSWLSRCGGESVAVPGSTPLDVKPGLAAQKVLRTLRMYVTRLRVNKDNEAKAEG